MSNITPADRLAAEAVVADSNHLIIESHGPNSMSVIRTNVDLLAQHFAARAQAAVAELAKELAADYRQRAEFKRKIADAQPNDTQSRAKAMMLDQLAHELELTPNTRERGA